MWGYASRSSWTGALRGRKLQASQVWHERIVRKEDLAIWSGQKVSIFVQRASKEAYVIRINEKKVVIILGSTPDFVEAVWRYEVKKVCFYHRILPQFAVREMRKHSHIWYNCLELPGKCIECGTFE